MKIIIFSSTSVSNIETLVTTNTFWSCGQARNIETGTLFAMYHEGDIFILGQSNGVRKRSSDADAPELSWPDPEDGGSKWCYEVIKFPFSEMIFRETETLLRYLFDDAGSQITKDKIGHFVKTANISLKDFIRLSRGEI